ncbi:MAG: nucleotidyltransferase family protein [Candidatus Ranarchaeia archaeon]
MSREEVQNIIITYLKNYNPEFVGIFGSYARNQSIETSDIDILVSFKKAYSLLKLIHMENELSDKLGIKVDLVTMGSLKNEIIKNNIMNDLQTIYRA